MIGVSGSDAEPWSLPLQEVAIALMCGNGVVLERGSALGERIRWVFERAGVPEGVVLVEPRLEGLDVQRVLGAAHRGQGPDARAGRRPLGHAVSGALWGGFATGGQAPSGIARVYVVREVAERFVAGPRRPGRGGCGPRRGGDSARSGGARRSWWTRPSADGAVLRCGGPAREASARPC